MARWNPEGNPQPTLAELVELGAEDNLDLILAQLFTKPDLAILKDSLLVAAETHVRIAKDCEAFAMETRGPMRETSLAQAAEAMRRAKAVAALLKAVVGPATDLDAG